jgi:pimeloyl-ACP methyl ester carboxylesterase
MGDSIQTGAGPVELERAGEGPPVVVVHGTPGGSDSSLAMGRFLVDAGFEVIAPSRPGYLGTPLGDRAAIDRQADLHAALLDALGIESAGVLSWSGGGPSAYRLAARHPDRVRALVAFASVSRSMSRPKLDTGSRLVMETEPGNWSLRFLAAHFPKSTIGATLKAEGDLSRRELKELVAEALGHDDEREVVLTMADVVADNAHRREGVDNDWERFAQIDSLELERVAAPTLVIHGSADTDVPPEHGEHAAATIPGAELLTMDRGTHLSLFVHPGARAFQARAVGALRS